MAEHGGRPYPDWSAGFLKWRQDCSCGISMAWWGVWSVDDDRWPMGVVTDPGDEEASAKVLAHLLEISHP